MPMHAHFEDIRYLIKEQSCVAEIIVREAMHLTESITGQPKTVDSEVLRTLTALVVKALDYDDVKMEYKQRERQRTINAEIDAALNAPKANSADATATPPAWTRFGKAVTE